jgi:formylmethanofuran dehydrogenase subunit C
MTKGFIQIEGDVTRWPGGQMKNGTILIKGKLGRLLEGFVPEGIIDNPEIDGTHFTGKYIKYIGDIGVDGKGTLWLNAEKNSSLL